MKGETNENQESGTLEQTNSDSTLRTYEITDACVHTMPSACPIRRLVTLSDQLHLREEISHFE